MMLLLRQAISIIAIEAFLCKGGFCRMRCPFCYFPETKVTDSRGADEGNTIRRRRECQQCNKRFTTYEMVEELPLMVIKKDGRRELFDRNKLINGLLRACEKRSISVSVIEDLVTNVEREIRNTLDREVTTQRLGETVMRHLKEIDQVAYVRFASVYRQFADIQNFMHELEVLMKQVSKPEHSK